MLTLTQAAEKKSFFRLLSETAAMSDSTAYFLGKFHEIWCDGLDARLAVECHIGQACMSIHHRLNIKIYLLQIFF